MVCARCRSWGGFWVFGSSRFGSRIVDAVIVDEERGAGIGEDGWSVWGAEEEPINEVDCDEGSSSPLKKHA